MYFNWGVLIIALIVVLYYFCGTRGLLRFTSAKSENDFLKSITLTGLIISVLSCIIIFYFLQFVNDSPFLLGEQSDDYTYDLIGWKVAGAWSGGYEYLIPLSMSSYKGYIYVNAIVYFLFGHFPIFLRLLNAVLSVFSAVLTYRIAKEVFDQKVARTSTVLFMLFPIWVIWTGLQYKDILLTFLALSVVYHAIMMRKEIKWHNIIFITSSIGLMYFMRFQSALGLVILVTAYFTLDAIPKGYRVRKSAIIVFVVSMWFVVIIGILAYKYSSTEYLAEYLFRMGEFHEARSAQFTADVSSVARFSAEWYTIPLYFMIATIFPLPTLVQLPNPYHLVDELTISGGLIWQVLLPFFIIGFVDCLRFKKKEAFPLYGWIFITLMGIVFLNYIMIWRHRLQMIPFILMITAFGITRYKKYRPILIFYYLVLCPFNIFAFNYLRLSMYGLLY